MYVKYVNKTNEPIRLPTPTGGSRIFRPGEGSFNKYYEKFCDKVGGMTKISLDEPLNNEEYKLFLISEKKSLETLSKLYVGTELGKKVYDDAKNIDNELIDKPIKSEPVKDPVSEVSKDKEPVLSEDKVLTPNCLVKKVGSNYICLLCNDNVERTTRGMNMHFSKSHKDKDWKSSIEGE